MPGLPCGTAYEILSASFPTSLQFLLIPSQICTRLCPDFSTPQNFNIYLLLRPLFRFLKISPKRGDWQTSQNPETEKKASCNSIANDVAEPPGGSTSAQGQRPAQVQRSPTSSRVRHMGRPHVVLGNHSSARTLAFPKPGTP